MTDLHVTRHLDDRDVSAIERLLERVQASDGHRPIDEQRWVDAVRGDSTDHTGLLLHEPDGTGLAAYGQVTRTDGAWAIDLGVDPAHRDQAIDLTVRVLRAAVDRIAVAGGGETHYWVHDPTDEHTRLAADLGLTPARDLLQMRVSLPLAETTDLVTRPFVPGQDEEAWLEVNNAAFAWHPEQGGLTLADVRAREAEPWFDPTGFLLHERDGRLAGFCWTKVHDGQGLGEIYVIAVHPDFGGQGLGRALTVAGLAHLSEQVGTGMLYVEADNAPAVGLYEDLGFTVHSTNRAYAGHVAPE